jgi:steroid delta-isomerase-like uncharacterized protein
VKQSFNGWGLLCSLLVARNDGIKNQEFSRCFESAKKVYWNQDRMKLVLNKPTLPRRFKMSTEQNKAVVRRWIEEGWNNHNLAVIDEVYAANYVQHEPAPETVNSSAALKQYVGTYLTAFPDLNLSIEDLIAEGDKVVWRLKSSGHNNGPFMGMPATGKAGSITGIVIFRLESGRIVEGWVNIDALGLMQQLGVIPMPG